jgi:hypothetical protein
MTTGRINQVTIITPIARVRKLASLNTNTQRREL